MEETMKLTYFDDILMYMLFTSSNFVGLQFKLTIMAKLGVWKPLYFSSFQNFSEHTILPKNSNICFTVVVYFSSLLPTL